MKILWKNLKRQTAGAVLVLAFGMGMLGANVRVRAEAGQPSSGELPAASESDASSGSGQGSAAFSEEILPMPETSSAPMTTESISDAQPEESPRPTGIALNETNFPDEAFRTLVQAWDTDQNGELSDSERAAVTSMDIRNKGITSLQGIGFFSSLEKLNCSGNRLEQLDMSGNPQLTSLVCNDNMLTSLNISSNSMLLSLHCHGNRLAALDVTHNAALMDLVCGDNPMTSIDLSQNKALMNFIYLGGPLQSLDVSQNTELVELWCHYTRIRSLDVSHNTNLKLLGADNNQLTFLDVSNNGSLQTLFAQENYLIAIQFGATAPPQIDLSAQKTLEIALEPGQTTFDLRKIAPLIDPGCISNVSGAQASETTLQGLSMDTGVSYLYQSGAAQIQASLHFSSTNEWTQPLSIEDWTYAQPPQEPHASAAYGQVYFEYASSPDGEFSPVQPTQAGTWYVRATVPETDGHGSMQDVQEFHIWKAQPEYTVPQGLSATYGMQLQDVLLPEGFTWTTPQKAVGDVGLRQFDTFYTPQDPANYATVEGIPVTLRVVPKRAQESFVPQITGPHDVQTVQIKDGTQLLRENTDYVIHVSKQADRVTVKFVFQGNYEGTILRGYSVQETDTNVSPVTPGKNKENPKTGVDK